MLAWSCFSSVADGVRTVSWVLVTVPGDVGGFRVFPDDVTAASGEIKEVKVFTRMTSNFHAK